MIFIYFLLISYFQSNSQSGLNSPAFCSRSQTPQICSPDYSPNTKDLLRETEPSTAMQTSFLETSDQKFVFNQFTYSIAEALLKNDDPRAQILAERYGRFRDSDYQIGISENDILNLIPGNPHRPDSIVTMRKNAILSAAQDLARSLEAAEDCVITIPVGNPRILADGIQHCKKICCALSAKQVHLILENLKEIICTNQSEFQCSLNAITHLLAEDSIDNLRARAHGLCKMPDLQASSNDAELIKTISQSLDWRINCGRRLVTSAIMTIFLTSAALFFYVILQSH